MRDGAKTRFVALFSARMTASAINSENCRQGSSYQPIGRRASTVSTLCCEIFEVDCFVRRFGISRQVFESFRDRRRSRGKVEEDTSVSQIHLCRDVQPEERIVRLDRGQL